MATAAMNRETRNARRPRAARGFTLTEVIIAMVIIGVLTAIAIPNYTAYVQRSRRAEARNQLLEVTNWMERWRTERGRYDDPANAGNPPPTPPFPTTLQQSPSTGTAQYTIVVAAPNAFTYTVTATPVGVMAGDVCGNLIINNTGQRTWSGGSGTMDVCWNR
jgi:prepilin-type N-terminal cleavage/methylation domain-containing protein